MGEAIIVYMNTQFQHFLFKTQNQDWQRMKTNLTLGSKKYIFLYWQIY